MQEPRRGRGRPARNAEILSRDKVLAAALTLLDEEGLGALSVRGLARRLAVAPMSLYNHVSSKEELLDAVHEAIISAAVPSATAEAVPWPVGVRQMARSLRLRLPFVSTSLVLRLNSVMVQMKIRIHLLI